MSRIKPPDDPLELIPPADLIRRWISESVERTVKLRKLLKIAPKKQTGMVGVEARQLAEPQCRSVEEGARRYGSE